MIYILDSRDSFLGTWRRPSTAQRRDLVENRLREVSLEEGGRWKRVAEIVRLQSVGLEREKDLENFLEAFGCGIFMACRGLM